MPNTPRSNTNLTTPRAVLTLVIMLSACGRPPDEGSSYTVEDTGANVTSSARDSKSSSTSPAAGGSDGSDWLQKTRETAEFVRNCTDYVTGHDKGDFTDGDGPRDTTSGPCAMDMLVTTNLVDADPNAAWWQHIPLFAPGLTQQILCRNAAGVNIPCYDESGVNANEDALIVYRNADAYHAPPAQHDADAVVLRPPPGEAPVTLPFNEIEAHQPLKVSLDEYPIFDLNREGLAARIWGYSHGRTMFSRCVEVGLIGKSVHFAWRPQPILEQIATISTAPCTDPDESLANVNFVYENGQRHFLNPCYKTLDGFWNCAFSPDRVKTLVPAQFMRHAKRIVAISEITRAVAGVTAAVVGMELFVGAAGIAGFVDSSEVGALMAAQAVKGVVGAVNRLVMCREEVGRECFQEKLDVGVNLAVNVGALLATPYVLDRLDVHPRELGIKLRSKFWTRLRSIWNRDEAEQAASNFIATYPLVNGKGSHSPGRISDRALELFVEALTQHPDGLTDAVLEALENVKSDDDMNKLTAILRSGASEWEKADESAAPLKGETTEAKKGNQNRKELCARSNGVHRGLAAGEESPPTNYQSENTFAHEPTSQLVNTVDDVALNQRLSALIDDTVEGMPEAREGRNFESWLLVIDDDLRAVLQEKFVDVLKQSFYEGTFDGYDFSQQITFVRSGVRSRYATEHHLPFHTDGSHATMVFTQEDPQLRELNQPYTTIFATYHNEQGYQRLGKRFMPYVHPDEWYATSPGALHMYFGAYTTRNFGLQAAVHTNPHVATPELGNRRFAFVLVKIEDDALNRLRVARIAQHFMKKENAMEVAKRLFDMRDTASYVGDSATALDLLRPLVDVEQSVQDNPIYRFVEEHFQGGLVPVSGNVLHEIADFLRANGVSITDDAKVCSGGMRRLHADCDGDGKFSDKGLIVRDEDHANDIFDCRDGEDPDGGWSELPDNADGGDTNGLEIEDEEEDDSVTHTIVSIWEPYDEVIETDRIPSVYTRLPVYYLH